ncbi:NAD(P)-bd-dom domain-containing protein [Mycena indigotica]|uniref:NAD(P)-bd-dom domain-containing protein n=1 Tax=Mycena indigotica TaxID=2126181 RepID=A0A8H6WI59_9AGAR|nr:NAD(P)-bd-dom domain-containing protein [Mycena indigotica]KAF7315783.1 NAD(P)-bd-dom domain-containing protein [Mycena indigotica]
MSTFNTLNVFAIGASRNIGYLTAIRLLEKGATVTLLLRSKSVFDGDQVMQRFVQSGQARLVQGDGLKQEDVRRAWAAAGDVDVLLFTVGGIPSFSVTKGFIQTPHNLVTQCLLNVVCTMPTSQAPKIIACSSTGLSPVAHKALPLPMRLLYNWIEQPHNDKLAMERVISHLAGWRWGYENNVEADRAILPQGWEQLPGLPAEGSHKKVLVVRPAFLTDGKSVADEKEPGYRYSEHDLPSCYTISRADISHFLVKALSEWDQMQGKRINVGY